MNYRLKNLSPIYKRLKMMLCHLRWNNQEDITKITDELRSGSAVVGTSDTVLGLFADVTYEGFLRLNTLKGRFEKPYLVLLKSQQHITAFVDEIYLFQIENILSRCWPGPLTIVVPAKTTVPDYMKSKEGTIAIRVPRHAGLQMLLSHFPGIFSTSANKAGEPIPSSVDQLDVFIAQGVSYYISDEVVNNTLIPSTIIQWSPQGFVLIRAGAYEVTELERLMQQRIMRPD